jgi:RNA recognition motif-containing protein
MNLYVSNLGDQITNDSLQIIFATHGEVRSSNIIKDHNTGLSRGFGFIEMPRDEEAQMAMARINGSMINGRNISVQEARPGPEPKGTLTERFKKG